MKCKLKRLWSEDEGATSIEYALIGSLVSIGIMSACAEIGATVTGLFDLVVAGFVR